MAAALFLRRAGHDVRILERFDKPRSVGSGLILQPTGMAVLEQLDLLERLLPLGAPIERILGREISSDRLVLDVRYAALGADWRGLAVHRSALFNVLHEAVGAAGIEVIPSMDLAAATDQEVVGENGRRFGPFDLIVDALGARSPFGRARRRILKFGALWVNVPLPEVNSFVPNTLEQRYRRASGMAGVMPIGCQYPGGPHRAAFFWSLRRSDFENWRRVDLKVWKDEVRRLWPHASLLIDPVGTHDEITFAQYDHYTLARPHSGRVAHIGDAAHATSPQLGQGANMALLDALALARAVASTPDVPRALSEYARLRRWHVRLFQWASATFTPFYQSDSRLLPWVRDRIAAPISSLPIGSRLLARLVAGMTVAPLAGDKLSPVQLGRQLARAAAQSLVLTATLGLAAMLAGGSEIDLFEIRGGGHTSPGGKPYLPAALVGKVSREIDANETIRGFFARHRMQ
jgi:salicylate hydroxylase